MLMSSRRKLAVAVCTALCFPAAAAAETYHVGPNRPYTTLGQVASLLAPGDVVEVDGDATYASVRFTKPGTAQAPITIRGLRVNGKRPVVSSGTYTVHFELSNHYVFEGFEVTGGTSRCVQVHAAYITIRDTLVRDCPAQGILATDGDTGWLTLERVEVARSGSEDRRHPIYVSSDPDAYPGAVFRMQHCYVHDGVGGNAVKSRAERNEIYYNWIENGRYRELELIGRDGEVPPRAMHSDIVGNVFIKGPGRTSSIARVGHDDKGHDDTGQYYGSRGRYRFVNNTFVVDRLDGAVIEAYGRLEAVEAHNNVFFRRGGPTNAAIRILDDEDALWEHGAAVTSGTNNWVMSGSTMIPSVWNGSIIGDDPGFANLAAGDVRPAAGSPLIDAGTTSAPASPSGYPFPSPLYPPGYQPPLRSVGASPDVRPVSGTIDIGAYESGQTPACTYTIAPTSNSFGSNGGSGEIDVSTDADCSWTAAANANWITVASGGSGTGSGSVGYAVAANSGSTARNGTLTVAGQVFTVQQDAAAGCTYSIAPTSASMSAAGGTGTVTVTAGAGCTWTATSNATWITVVSGGSGSGDGSVGYSVAANSGSTSRNGTLTVAGATFTVAQAAGGSAGTVVDVYADQQDVTFTGGSSGVQAVVVAGEGVGGSFAIKHTNLALWSSSKRLHFATPVNISGVLATDKLQISLDLSAGGPNPNAIHIYFNNNWEQMVVAPGVDSAPGYQTFTLSLGAVRSKLGNSVNDIYFKAGSGFPSAGTLWVDNVKFIRP